MAKRVLVPIDGSPPAREALEHALDEFPDATIVVLHAIDLSDMYLAGDVDGGWMANVEGIQQRRRKRAEDLFEEARSLAEDRGITIETAVETGTPARTIVEYAEENDVDHVVMGSHGRSGAARIFLGSVAELVARRSPVPVTIVR